MSRSRQGLFALALSWIMLAAVGPAAAAQGGRETPELAGEAVSPEAREVVRWVLASRDNRGMPFAVVDKKHARLFLFEPHGRLAGATPVLLGMARGDESAPGVGELPPSRIPVADRTTPAGRFVTEPGRNLHGEEVVWFDYAAGLAIHRLRDDAAHAARQQRLASASPDAHRVSAGCVVVPVPFFESMVSAMLGRGRGVVYVLPETRSVREVFAHGVDEL